MCVCSISGPGVKTPHALWPKIQNIKWKQYCCNKFNKDLKNGPQPKKILKKKSPTSLNKPVHGTVTHYVIKG